MMSEGSRSVSPEGDLAPQGHVQQLLTDRVTNTTIKLPATARYNPDRQLWEETDSHRLAQRRKQISFGKVTVGYRIYVAAVPVAERQEGNELHPETPRLDQVCSKRSWDAQIGQWRRMLHAWDSGPSAASMRKTEAELRKLQERRKRRGTERNHFKLEGNDDPRHVVEQVLVPRGPGDLHPAHEVEIGRADRGRADSQPPPPPLQIKFCIRGDTRCFMVVSPKNIPFSPFKQLLQEKLRWPIVRISYSDCDGDQIAADDDASLKAFLDGAGVSHAPKLELDVEGTGAAEEMELPPEVRWAFRSAVARHQLSAAQAAELRAELLCGVSAGREAGAMRGVSSERSSAAGSSAAASSGCGSGSSAVSGRGPSQGAVSGSGSPHRADMPVLLSPPPSVPSHQFRQQQQMQQMHQMHQMQQMMQQHPAQSIVSQELAAMGAMHTTPQRAGDGMYSNGSTPLLALDGTPMRDLTKLIRQLPTIDTPC